MYNNKYGATSMEQIEKNCKCGKQFAVTKSRDKTAKYCSRQCLATYRPKKKSGYKNPLGSIAKMGSKNPMYRKYKEKVEIQTVHRRIEKEYPKPIKCEFCGEVKKLELSCKDHKYSFNPKDYQWICKKCHFHYDHQEKNLEMGRYKGKNKGKHPRSEFKKGIIPWNKGKTGIQVAWNKGLGKTSKVCHKCGGYKANSSKVCRNCRLLDGWTNKSNHSVNNT